MGTLKGVPTRNEDVRNKAVVSEMKCPKTEILMSTFNFHSAYNGGLEMMARDIESSKIYTAIITETKLTGVYTRFCSGYNIIATDASCHRGGL